jgi:hypothetical protein
VVALGYLLLVRENDTYEDQAPVSVSTAETVGLLRYFGAHAGETLMDQPINRCDWKDHAYIGSGRAGSGCTENGQEKTNQLRHMDTHACSLMVHFRRPVWA